ncbi:MAG TPA: hypothetical protein VMV46_21365, partial [Thermoanaerobaculia bacterium]|nr:hypothetical protein [Thermoanaerobaculia bacterium]
MSVEPTTHPRTQRSRLERVARLVVLALILAGVLVALLVSLHRAFQVDEVEHMHAGYHVASGRLPYVEFWQLHDPLLYGMLGPITDPGDPRASYRRGRALMLLLLVGTAGAAAAAAGRLAGREGAALAAGLLLLHTTFVERGIEVRPDGLAAFLATLALALELGPRAERPAVGFARGALLALAVLATKKSLFVVGLFGLWWLARAGGRRRLAPLTPILGLLATAAVASFAMLALGNLEPYLRATWLTSAEAVGGSEVWVPFGPWGFLVREGARNLAFVVVAASGWIACLALAVGERAEDRRLLFPALLAAGAVASRWLQPFPW